MLIIGLATAAMACTGSYSSRVVGSHPTDDLVVVRVESEGLRDPLIRLVLYEATTGTERKRFPILDSESGTSPQVRGRNWTAAEAELQALGIVFSPDLTGVALLPSRDRFPMPVTLGAATLVFSNGSTGDGADTQRTLQVEVQHNGTTLTTHTLAHWMWMSSGNEWHDVHSVWALPQARAAVFESNPCSEPSIHFIELQTAALP